MMDHASPLVSVVVPVRLGLTEPEADVTNLVERLGGRLDEGGVEHEFLFVLDGERPALARAIEALDHGRVRLVELHMPFGESTALSVGLNRAQGERIIVSSPDLRVEVDSILETLDRLGTEADLFSARRHPRRGKIGVRVPSALFHWLVRRVTGTSFRDITSGFHVMTRAVADELDLYGDLHRFIPLLAQQSGFRVKEVAMPQSARNRKTAVFSPLSYLRRFLDIVTIFFLARFTQRPNRFFGGLGLFMSVLGAGILLYLVLHKLLGFGGLADRPLLYFGGLLLVVGVQVFSLGLLAEVMIYFGSRRHRLYRVQEVYERQAGQATTAHRSEAPWGDEGRALAAELERDDEGRP